jgi:hypothetical protein
VRPLPAVSGRKRKIGIFLTAGFAAGVVATVLFLTRFDGTIPSVLRIPAISANPPQPPVSKPSLSVVDSVASAASKPAMAPAANDRPQDFHKTVPDPAKAEAEIVRRALLGKNTRFAELQEQIRTEEAWINQQINDAWRAGRLFDAGYTREMAAERFKANRLFLDIKKNERDRILKQASGAELPDRWDTVDAGFQGSRKSPEATDTAEHAGATP